MPESRSLLRMPVYDVADGRVVGRVHRLIVDPDARKIAGLLLAGRFGRGSRCLPFENIHAVGRHAVTVKGTEAISRLSERPDMEELHRSKRRLHHSPVLTEDGTFVGDVDEFTVSAQTGRIERLLVSGGILRDVFRGQGALPAHFVLTIGEDATIVRDEAVHLLAERKGSGADSARRPAREDAAPAPARPWLARFGLGKAKAPAPPDVVVIDGRSEAEDGEASAVPQLGGQTRLQQHRAQDGHHVVPADAAHRGKGGDRTT